MKLNFNNTKLFQEISMVHTTNSTPDLTSTKLKIWWQGLPQEEKRKVCSLDTPSIMSDIANAANNALVVCKLNHTYKKKDLISWTKSKNQDAEVISQTFEFSFVGKEILEDCLAELFSCFYIFIARCRKPEEFSDTEGPSSCQAEPKSHIGVKEERLDSLLDLLSHSICDFSENRKPVVHNKDVSELYFSLIKDLPHKMMLNANTTLHAYMKVLLERLAVYSFVLEHQIYSAYFEAAPKEQETIEQSVLSQLSNLTPLASATPLVTKTVTQIEKELNAHELSVDQNSTASGSPRNPIVLGTPQNLNLEELSQKLLQKSPKDQSAGSMARELSEPSSEMKPKLHEEFIPHNYRKNSAIQMWNEGFDTSMFTYEGCLVGNLQIPFDITDQALMEEDEQSETIAEERDFGIIEYEEFFEVPEQQEDQPEEAEKEDYQTGEGLNMPASLTSFNMMSNPMMNYQSAYSAQQNYLYTNQEYYSPYMVQQNYSMMSYNYTVPMMYNMAPQNTMDSTGTENQNYSVYNQRHKEFEAQASYENDNSYYQTQKYNEHYKTEYEGHQQVGQSEEKNYYNAREKPRYDVRPKLPPRFQKRKENMVRT